MRARRAQHGRGSDAASRSADRDLAHRFVAADEATLRAVYDRYGRAVYTVTYSILRDPFKAADAAQATFVSAWRAAPRFDPDQELAPWLYAIARRSAIDVYRRDRRVQPVDPDDLDGLGATDESFERTWEAWQVRLAIDQLPPSERQVVQLSWFDGLTHPDIAERMGVPVGTVKSRSHRAHQRLAAALARVRGENRTGPGIVGSSGGIGAATDGDAVSSPVPPASR